MSKFVNPIQLKKQIQNKIQSAEPDLSQITSKAQKVDKFTAHIFRKTHKSIFLLLILICAIFGIPMLSLNYMSSLANSQNASSITLPTNSISLMLLNFSTFSTIYYSETNAYIQVFILLALLIFSLALLLLVETWLKYVPKLYKERIVRIQNYSLQITVREKIRRKQIKEFTEYLDDYTTKCLKWKIFQLQSIQGKTVQERFLLNLLKQISKKPTAIQDAITLPFRTKDVPAELLDLRQQASNILIAVFTYPQVAQVALEWWQDKQNSQTIKVHIVDVSAAPSSRNILFDKLQNKGDYKNKVVSAEKYTFIAVLWQILFFLLFSALIYLSTMPSLIFTSDFKTANEFMFKYGMLAAQGLLLFLHVKFFHQIFIPGYLLKSFPSILTFQEEANKSITWSIFLLIWDFFIIPSCAHFLVGLADLEFTFKKFSFIVEDSIFSQNGISNLLVCYCAIKHVLAPFLKVVFRLLRKCFSKCRRCSEYPSQEQDLIAYASIFIEFTILFCWSILCSPAICCIAVLGLLFKLQEFCNLKEFKRTCLISICSYMQKLINLIKYFIIIVGGIIMNSLLDGYILAIKPQFMNPLIIGSSCSVFILIGCIFLGKVEPNSFQKLVYCFFQTLPESIESKLLYNPQEQQKYNMPRLAPLLDEMTKAIVEKIFANQQILFTYNQELKENKGFFNSQIPQLNAQESAKKINQEMNTMSRSLEESLKNRLLAKPINPFEIAPSTREQQGQFSGIIYEDKVVMAPRKFKNVFIPLLQLPYGNRRSQPQPQKQPLQSKYIHQLKRHNTIGETNQKGRVKRTYEQYNMAQNETNSWGDAMIHGAQTELEQKGKKSKVSNKKENEKMNKITQEREKKEQEMAEEMLQRKVKFTDLFDSDEESIKNLVKRKIKQSIPKLK